MMHLEGYNLMRPLSLVILLNGRHPPRLNFLKISKDGVEKFFPPDLVFQLSVGWVYVIHSLPSDVFQFRRDLAFAFFDFARKKFFN